MKIPQTTKRPRFYVATSLDHAFSSWGTHEEARASYLRWAALVSDTAAIAGPRDRDFAQIVGIVVTGPTGREMLPIVKP